MTPRPLRLLRLRCWIGAALLLGPVVAAAQPAPPRPPMAVVPRDSIANRLRDLHRIHTPEGIEETVPLEVNGSRQWISIRGLNRANPVLLVLHGGPGSALMGMMWAYQKPWEDFFTVVNWEQRGVGKNFSAADSARLGATLTPEQLAEDAEVVVKYLREKLGPRKIAVMGFSYGTSIGPRLVQRHPEWYSVYVGVGQMTNAENESIIYREVERRARAAKDTAVLARLSAIAPYPPKDRTPTTREMSMIRGFGALFDGNWYGKKNLDLYYALPQWGPDYSLEEATNVNPAMGWMGRHLINGKERQPIVDRFAIPVVIMGGRHDLMTTYAGAQAYFQSLSAPKKQFITFERSAHFIMFEEPGRFLMTMVNVVLPLAGGSKPFPAAQ